MGDVLVIAAPGPGHYLHFWLEQLRMWVEGPQVGPVSMGRWSVQRRILGVWEMAIPVLGGGSQPWADVRCFKEWGICQVRVSFGTPTVLARDPGPGFWSGL